jgi:hypothetical protein
MWRRLSQSISRLTGLTNANSDQVVVSPATADRLVFTTQPGGLARVGSIFSVQPVVKSRDAFGNLSTVGLPANLSVMLTLNTGSGSLWELPPLILAPQQETALRFAQTSNAPRLEVINN